MRITKLSIIIGLISAIAFASCINKNSVDSLVGKTINLEDVSSFILEDFEILNLTYGDLNRDSILDAVLVLNRINEIRFSDVVDHPEPRPLLLLIGQGEDKYKVADINSKTVYCIDCGGMLGDPFVGIVIKNGYFSVEHYGGSSWRWSHIVTYKYSDTECKWFLHRDGGDSFHADMPETKETIIKTVDDFGEVEFNEFDIYADWD